MCPAVNQVKEARRENRRGKRREWTVTDLPGTCNENDVGPLFRKPGFSQVGGSPAALPALPSLLGRGCSQPLDGSERSRDRYPSDPIVDLTKLMRARISFLEIPALFVCDQKGHIRRGVTAHVQQVGKYVSSWLRLA